MHPYLPPQLRLTNLRTLLLHHLAMSTHPPPKRPIRVLMLHGYTQSGPLFHAKTRALEKNLQKAFPAGISLHYPTAPIRLAPADVPGGPAPTNNSNNSSDAQEGGAEQGETVDAWAWWRRSSSTEPYVYEGLDLGLAHLASILQTAGPFDGVIGFSQGGACAAMLASLLEPNRRAAFDALKPQGGISYPASFESTSHPPLKFAVSYSGFAATRGTGDVYRAFYEPKIATPMLHFLGSLDAVVEEARSLALVAACEVSEGRVVYHPGGHFLPSSQKAYVGALIGFMKEVLYLAVNKEKKEESAQDMDVPF